MYHSSTPMVEAEAQPRAQVWRLGAAAAAVLGFLIVGYTIGGELGQIALGSLQTIPFVVLAVLAYLGVDRLWAKIVALGWLGLVVGGMALFALGLAMGTVLTVGDSAPGDLSVLGGGAGLRILVLLGGLLLSVVVASIAFLPAVRRWLSRYLPLDPRSFVHTIALVAVIALTLSAAMPLLAFGTPPLLALVGNATEQGMDLTSGRGDRGLLLDTLYSLVWLVPGAILAVGFGVRRSFREALTRLGLVSPSLAQIGIGVGAAVVLVGVVTLLSMGVEWFWGVMGWPMTDGETFSELLKFAMSPIGAVVIGVTAGLGEELAVRGVLQPRLGIVLSNLFFTSLHAFQYNWDSLLIVFVIGLVLGVIRKRTNTTTSAIAHGAYDFILIMLSVMSVPYFSE